MIKRSIPVLLLVFLFACGASARQKTIRITYESTNIADDQLKLFTKTRGKAIVDAAIAAGKTKEQTSAEVEAFLAKAEYAHLIVLAVYRMVAAASALDDDRSLAALVSVAEKLAAELKGLGMIK